MCVLLIHMLKHFGIWFLLSISWRYVLQSLNILTPLLREDCGIKLNGLIFLKTFESNVDKLED